ncbi:hypothetical protein SK128_013228 [Halocaridina rubra]|uniref:Uncharacterized protein n=1 Tax=Halocaridina rubra TaxID=373956 RepID=A0AAN8WF31_HALRR
MINHRYLAECSSTSRREYIEGLQNFIEKSSSIIEKFSNNIGWSPQRDRQVSRVIHKPLDEEGKNEYSEEPLLPSSNFNPANKITIDAEKQREILQPFWKETGYDSRQTPSSAGEMTVNFSKEERLALYEYSVKHAPSVAKPPELLSVEDVLNNKDHLAASTDKLSPLELKKAMRDLKRRRQAYRTKVSTKNKSQTQVTREIIHNMMVFLGVEEQAVVLGREPTTAEKGSEPAISKLDSKPYSGLEKVDASSFKRSYRNSDDHEYKQREKKYRRNTEANHDREYEKDRYESRYHKTSKWEKIESFESKSSRRERHEERRSSSSRTSALNALDDGLSGKDKHLKSVHRVKDRVGSEPSCTEESEIFQSDYKNVSPKSHHKSKKSKHKKSKKSHRHRE